MAACDYALCGHCNCKLVYEGDNSPVQGDTIIYCENCWNQLLKERDEALKRGDAYREVAIRWRILWGEAVEPIGEYHACEDFVDAEVEKILER